MKRSALRAGAAAALAMATALLSLAQAADASAATTHRADDAASGAITVQSWLYAVPSENVLSATVWDCFKITGAINDRGGGPTWTSDTSYHEPNSMSSGGSTAASQECADKAPAGGFILVPPPEAGQYQFATYTAAPGSPGGLSTLYAIHTLVAQRGDIYITFAGTYNMTGNPVPVKLPSGSTVEVQPLTTGPDCTWLITGGTGAYTGIQGDGTCFGNAENTFPWVNHTEEGTVWFARTPN
ncbi:MAG TPA: hypothetical protein VMF65_05690 [Acidimicrobiales bacterium]|nr:hypothetical protein [Acidimicrobiales bacterium]